MAELLPLGLIELQAAVYRADKRWDDRLIYWTEQIMENPEAEDAADADMISYVADLQEARADLEKYEAIR